LENVQQHNTKLSPPIAIVGVKAIKQIQDNYKELFEQKSIAQELVQNSLNAKQQANIRISDRLILLQIQNIKEEEIRNIVGKINRGLNRAKECYYDINKRKASLERYQNDLKSHGRGFLTIFYFGWDIVTLKNKNQILIAAVKH